MLTGASGQLGRAFVRKSEGEYNVLGIGRNISNHRTFEQGNITDRKFITNTIENYSPDVIVHFAAMTGVDECEKNPILAKEVNTTPVEWILNEFTGYFIFISTDYLFDGKDGPYSEDAETNPINVYGKSKLDAENIIRLKSKKGLILRTNVLFDYTDWTSASFVNWVVKSLRNRKPISVVMDQFNNPIWTEHLAEIIILLMKKESTGLYHTGSVEYLNRYDFVKMIAKEFQLNEKLISSITSKELNQKAIRPLKGGLITQKLVDDHGINPPSLAEALSTLSNRI